MIIREQTQKLVTIPAVQEADFQDLLQESREIAESWRNGYVDNTKTRNYELDESLTFHYNTMAGEKRHADISESAFTQLCARVGVPAGYVKKCFETGKQDLALANFRVWANESKEQMLIRERNGIVQAVLGGGFKTYDGYHGLRAIQHTIDFDRYAIRQYKIGEDNTVVRFVEREPFTTDHNSPLFIGFTISNSDTGRGALSIKFTIYRQICTNGLTVQQLGGTLYRQIHAGEGMNASKLTVMRRCFKDIDAVAEAVKEKILISRRHNLKDYEVAFYIEKARRELKLSEKATQELTDIINNSYEPTTWGVVNGVTELAQRFTLDTRLTMEAWAGDMLARAA